MSITRNAIFPIVLSVVVLLEILALPQCALAEIPQIINYQGKVTDSGGNPVADGTYNMRFRIYDAATGGSLHWDSFTQSIAVSNGIFNVNLGESPMVPILTNFDQDFYLLVTFNGVNQTPRQRLVSTGYAYMASGLAAGTESSGSVTSSPYSVFKAINTATTGTRYGLYGVSSANTGIGVCGESTANSGSTMGVQGKTSSPTGRGVYGYATSNSGYCYGVIGYTQSSQGYGVWGWSTAGTGDTRGVYGSTGSTSGSGVYGSASNTSGFNYGVYGISSSAHGAGVYGEVTSNSGSPYGGQFYASGQHAWALYGRGDGTGFSHGVMGICNSTIGGGVCGEGPVYGVEGQALANTGVSYGGSFWSASSLGRGVDATADYLGGRFKDLTSNNYGYVGYDTYKVYGTGTNSFVQNHPYRDDLVITYSAPEGNETATYTRGTGRLVNGEARIPLDETFALVTNPSIGLTAHITPRGEWANLFVKELTTKEMVVAAYEGSDDVRFDYIVYGLRIGFEELSIVQEKPEESYIPSMHEHRALFRRRPELRKYTTLERFTRMYEEARVPMTADWSEAEALLSAIGEYDPAVHGPADPDPNADLRRQLREERLRADEERARIRASRPSMESVARREAELRSFQEEQNSDSPQ